MKTLRRRNLELPETGDVVFKKYGKVTSTACIGNLEYQYNTESGMTIYFKFDSQNSDAGTITII